MTLHKLAKRGSFKAGIKITLLFLFSNIAYICYYHAYEQFASNRYSSFSFWIFLAGACSFIISLQYVAQWMFSFEYYNMVRIIPYALDNIPLPEDIIRNNRAQNWFWLVLNTVVAIWSGVDDYKYYVYA